MRASVWPLPSLEIPVRGRCAAFAAQESVVVHRHAHRTARITPFETGVTKDTIEPLGLRLQADSRRAGYRDRRHIRRDLPSGQKGRGLAKILEAAVGAGPDEDSIDTNLVEPGARLEAHIAQAAQH